MLRMIYVTLTSTAAKSSEGGAYTNHIKYLISSEPHRHLNPRRID